ncbi:hypothetical protein [Paenibacillus sp. 4624]|uniref:hypothetical protein n=1 Tax=Paenibacillus sp. 4624 TaxID=3156453 RepID=UPI003D1FACC0
MWGQNKPIIIDWESAGEINPKHDLIETAIYWSIDELGQLNKSKFKAFLSGYRSALWKSRSRLESCVGTGLFKQSELVRIQP